MIGMQNRRSRLSRWVAAHLVPHKLAAERLSNDEVSGEEVAHAINQSSDASMLDLGQGVDEVVQKGRPHCEHANWVYQHLQSCHARLISAAVDASFQTFGAWW